MLDGEGAKETVRDGAQHAVEVGFGAEFAGEFDEGAAVVVAVAIEDVAVQDFLEPVADGLEDEGGDEDDCCGD